jgi:hypothetical protein
MPSIVTQVTKELEDDPLFTRAAGEQVMDFVDDDNADFQLLQYQQRANLHFHECHRVAKARTRTAQELRIDASFGRFRRQRNRKDGNALGAANRVDSRRVCATKFFDKYRFAHAAMRIDRKTWGTG